MKLQEKFKRVFIIPLICGIVLSIIFTLSLLFLNGNRLSDPEILRRMQIFENDKTLPIIQTSKNIIFKKFQSSINSLKLFWKYYEFYSDFYDKDLTQNQKENIKKYSLSGLNLATNSNSIKFINNNTDSTILGKKSLF